ncbi:PEP-CTERM sorting domain-containing protein [Massilia sp. CCM 9210]|uniref:PEP-CTERM sorting domain-containing protein n=1 Tax=Massilia scottii TaxID=3057166 RepID=UPI0027968426|nr:PEP-CTERM sorting domain-containing protein [Massilia sp. CCM 9210]MDQ1811974.1 PEP-CTERM sorting domain-containing protein [Massilia sp. CCM 9210]
MTSYMNKLLTAFTVAALSLPLSAAAGTYTLTSPGTDQYAWVNAGKFEIGRFSLQSDVGDIIGLNTSVTLRDQGWGNQDLTNGVYVGLFAGDTALYTLHVAGANHDWKTDNYSLISNAGHFAGINAALDSAQWNAGVTVRMYTDAWDYPGWALHTRNVSLDMTSGVLPAVPEPSSYGMMLGGLTLLGVVAWRRQGRTMSRC